MDRSFETLIKQTNNAVNRDADKFAQTLGLTSVQISIIDYVSQEEDCRNVFQKDVEQEFNIRRATATSALKLMEERDLIVRVSVKQDARLKRILLTPKSHLLAKKINNYFDMTEKKIAQVIGMDNKDEFKNALKQVINSLSD